MGAIALRPVNITDDVLVSTDAVESTALWSNVTSYNDGDRVRSDTTHMIYESAQGSNTNHDPTVAANQPEWWIEIGPTNDWAMFDAVKTTRTLWEGSGTVVLQPGSQVDSIAFARVTGTTLTVRANDGVDDIYERIIDLVSIEGITDWYSWFYQERVQEDTIFLDDLPALGDPIITIILEGSDEYDPIAIGACQVGRQLDIGSTELGPNLGYKDYSTYEEDGFGGTDVVERGYAFWQEARLFIANTRIKYIRQQLLAYRAVPIFFVLDDNLTVLISFGFLKRFDIEIPYHDYSLVSLRVEETLE